MADQFFSTNDQRCVNGRITVPLYGAWCADVELAGAIAGTGDTSLVLGDLKLKGTIRAERTATFAGKVAARIVGGKDGWNKEIKPKGYSHNVGVRMSTILEDAAREVKEQIVIAADKQVGLVWARRAGPASRVLRRLLGGKWWIDELGITQTKARPSTLIATPFQILDYKPNRGLFTIATENYKDWMPGRKFRTATLSAEQTISSTTFTIADGKVALQILNSESKEERLLSQIRAIVSDQVCQLEAGSIVEFEITSAEEMVIACRPTGVSSPWPALSEVKLKAGLFGEKVTPTVGAKCLIIFMDNDPGLYRCIGIEGVTQQTSFDASGNITATVGGFFKVCGGSNFAALSNLCDTNYSNIASKFDSHFHPCGVGPTGPPTVPMVSFPSVACTKLKTD